MSYPLGDCFEEMTAKGIRPVPDQAAAREQAGRLVRDLVALVPPYGHFLVLFFDSESTRATVGDPAVGKDRPVSRRRPGLHPACLRLILNALTTPHVFLGGDLDQYQRQCTKADRAVALVALSLLEGAVGFTVADAVTALVNGPNGATGEDFLGYSHGPSLHATVQRGLAWLIAEQAVRAIDGARFEQHRDTRRRLIAALSGP